MPGLTIFIGHSNAVLTAAVDRAIDTTANAFEVRRWPEMHPSGPLHPSFHAAEADACMRAARARPVVVCTHSDPFVLRVRRRVAEQTIRPDRVSLVWVDEDGAERPIPLNDRGTPAWWPKVDGVSAFAEAQEEFKAIRRALDTRDQKRGELPTVPERP